MKKVPVAPFVVCALLAGACTVSPVGTWELDKAAMKVASTALPAADVDRMLGGIGESTIELKADGTAALRAKVVYDGKTIEDDTTGTWKLEGGELYVVAKGRRGPDVVEVFDYGGSSLTGRLSTLKLTMIYRRR